jgi:hypothetical protein
VGGCVKLPAALALGAGETGEKVFVDLTELVLCTIRGGTERDVADQIDDLPEPNLVEPWAGIVLGSTPLSEALSRSIAVMASSINWPMVGCGAIDLR